MPRLYYGYIIHNDNFRNKVPYKYHSKKKAIKDLKDKILHNYCYRRGNHSEYTLYDSKGILIANEAIYGLNGQWYTNQSDIGRDDSGVLMHDLKENQDSISKVAYNALHGNYIIYDL